MQLSIMFVYSTEVESGGRLWPILVDRLLVCVAFSNLLLSLSTSPRILEHTVLIPSFRSCISRSRVALLPFVPPSHDRDHRIQDLLHPALRSVQFSSLRNLR